ncbi:unnamed protein product [Penicillium nalgiovense]|uniref:Uncharacterized protein n=1 Tax=Penicillium nalgiovense TaxID=60175 RepID=A0A9W4HZH1_PENNA|nr:unnamed protein product [Penicillium nalgiovense]CAG7977627.1 unnamed protein product [Penicillium nalgiovense]CAG8032944.1 unnamed protein product [Penicillium nalgiovense]CAG8034231.1 unnamed protein product [Penicillium nalgiovense]CAG8049623.1 unnamed protein product [Penicillium nalgiovense]
MTRMHYASVIHPEKGREWELILTNLPQRTMEGVEMARIAARDLRRRHPGGDNCDAASRNPTVKIDLSGRKLTDEGFDIFIDALLETLQKEKDDKHPGGFVRLLKLHLGGNCLTFKSLPKLGMAIRLSTGDLNDLDLSQNCIEISTAGQRAAWKYFLNSFEECYMLKRVNFSGNPLGTLGVETLARVYIRSKLGFPDQSTALPEEGHDPSVGQSEGLASDDNDPGIDCFPSLSIYDNSGNSVYSGDQDPTPQPQEPSEIASESNRRHFRKTRGLRSVPDLILTQIHMSSVGVIHLAGILCMQESREFLCFYLPKKKVGESRPETEKKKPSVTWHLNEHLPQRFRQAPCWATEIAQLGLSFDSSLAVAIDNLETPPSSGLLRGSRSWKGRYEIKFRYVVKVLYALASESEIRGSEIWTMALKMAKMMETVLFNEEVIRAQLSSGGKVFECLGLQRDLVDAINIGVSRSRQLLDGQSQEPWCLGMSLDIWSDVMGMALDKGDVLTAQQRMNILGYVGRGNQRVPEKAMEIWGFLFDVDCAMYHAS